MKISENIIIEINNNKKFKKRNDMLIGYNQDKSSYIFSKALGIIKNFHCNTGFY